MLLLEAEKILDRVMYIHEFLHESKIRKQQGVILKLTLKSI
jgi:hypothetical protein